MLTSDVTLPHARARDPYRQFELAECRCKLFLPILQGVSCAVQAVACLVISLAKERRSTLFAHRVPRPSFPSRLSVAVSDNATFSASNGGVEAYSYGFACVLHSFSLATHLARTLGFPGCRLSVSVHPVLMGPFPVSRRHFSLGTLSNMLWRRMYSTSSRLALAHSSGSSHPPLSSQCQPSHRLSSPCSSWCTVCTISSRAARSLVPVVLMGNTANPLCIRRLPFLFPRLQLLLILLQLLFSCLDNMVHPCVGEEGEEEEGS